MGLDVANAEQSPSIVSGAYDVWIISISAWKNIHRRYITLSIRMKVQGRAAVCCLFPGLIDACNQSVTGQSPDTTAA